MSHACNISLLDTKKRTERIPSVEKSTSHLLWASNFLTPFSSSWIAARYSACWCDSLIDSVAALLKYGIEWSLLVGWVGWYFMQTWVDYRERYRLCNRSPTANSCISHIEK